MDIGAHFGWLFDIIPAFDKAWCQEDLEGTGKKCNTEAMKQRRTSSDSKEQERNKSEQGGNQQGWERTTEAP